MAEHFLPRTGGPSGPPCASVLLPDLKAADPAGIVGDVVGEARRCSRLSRMEALRSSRFDDFPSAMGLLPIQGSSGEVAAARHRHILLFVGDIELQRVLFVIFIFGVDLSVIYLL
jgi:hypothetical protein